MGRQDQPGRRRGNVLPRRRDPQLDPTSARTRTSRVMR
jgi:hypothetical protein